VSESENPIVEAVAFLPGRLAWVAFSDESNDVIETTPVTTVCELIARLATLPPQTPVLVDGYEDGFSGINSIEVREVLEMAGRLDCYGRFDTTAEARATAAADPSKWQITDPPVLPPTLVGEPVHAVILRRERP
jgi:hypothetical protein